MVMAETSYNYIEILNQYTPYNLYMSLYIILMFTCWVKLGSSWGQHCLPKSYAKQVNIDLRSKFPLGQSLPGSLLCKVKSHLIYILG